MQKVSITVDLSKIDRARIIERTYTNGAGEQVTAKEYKMDVVEMKAENHKTIASGDGWAMVKKFFVCDQPTKEERAAQAKTAFLGEGIVFVDMKASEPVAAAPLTDEDHPY